VIRQLQGGRIAGQLVFIDKLFFWLLELLLCEAVGSGKLPAGTNRCHFVPLNDLLDLLRMRLVVMKSSRYALQLTVLQNTSRSTAQFVHLLRVVVTAPVLFVALATVAVVHVAIQHQTRRRPGALYEDQLVEICKLEV